MNGSDSAEDTTVARLVGTVSTRLGDTDSWAVERTSPDRVTVELPDRRLDVQRRDGPDGTDHWTLALAADGTTVSKFGPFDAVTELTGRVEALLDSDIRYTVCCDG